VDITSTGETLKANGLRILADGVILKSEACLVARAGLNKKEAAEAASLVSLISAS
jgi:ATP phosphoribosyltransferase